MTGQMKAAVRRRDFLKMAAAGLLAGCHAQPTAPPTDESPRAPADEPTATPVAETSLSLEERGMDDQELILAAPCGLYCAYCSDLVDGRCHGCGCDCGHCAAAYHHGGCQIYRCARGKGLATCAKCDDFACTRLIHFAYDPIWHTHRPVLDNLRRIQQIGLGAWVEEQDGYWSDQRNLDKWVYLHRQCGKTYSEFEGSS